MKNFNRTIIVDFGNQAQYENIIGNGRAFIELIMAYILSLGFQVLHKNCCSSNCFTRHSHYARVKCNGITIWRIQCTSCKAVFTVIPSFIMRYFCYPIERVKQALIAYHSGSSLEVCAILHNISAMSLYRIICSLGKYSLCQVLGKAGLTLPKNILADEKHSKCLGEKGYIPLITSGHTTWHIDYVESVEEKVLEDSYKSFDQQVKEVNPQYAPKTVSHDGFRPTANALKNIFGGKVAFLLCWLHTCRSLQNLLKNFSKPLSYRFSFALFKKLQACHQKPSLQKISLKNFFNAMLRTMKELLTEEQLTSVKDWIKRKKTYLYQTMDHPLSLAFSYSLDHICNHLDRKLFMMKYFHHPNSDKSSFLKGFILIHNFIPYQRRAKNAGMSPCQVDGARLPHPDWLVSLLILTSAGYH